MLAGSSASSGNSNGPALQKAFLLSWLARLRWLSSLCCHPVLQATILSVLPGVAGCTAPPLSQVLQSFQAEFHREDGDDPQEPGLLLRACRAAAQRRGLPLELSLCFAALCRALGIRARIVQSLKLDWNASKQLREDVKRRSCTLGDKKSDKFLDMLLKCGMDEGAAIGAILHAESLAKSSKSEFDQKLVLTVAALGTMADRPPKAEAGKFSLIEKAKETAWVEYQDPSTDAWVAVNKPNALDEPYWICAADDCLLGDGHCAFSDLTQHYADTAAAWHRVRKIRAESVGMGSPSRCFDSWWDSMLSELSGGPGSSKEIDRRGLDCSSLPEPVKRRRKLSLEPFVEHADEVHAWVTEHGLLPWHKSKDDQERRLGLWVKAVTDKARAGKLHAARRKHLVTLIPIWNLAKDPQNSARAEVVVIDSETDADDNARPHEIDTSPADRKHDSRQWARLTIMRINLEVSRCQTTPERRQLIRQKQLEFHPDKNGQHADKVRPVFQFVQSLWREHLRATALSVLPPKRRR
eukprot:TRINITY_DN45642_c0_g1_i1.p1 TRINITY_DN45642_c0_g1~~TRINITY_DN45642_c0_g1_i1.p1  ORF type:complete len:523 (+),score=90.47 TRINITY_DN45642_c0_g1_i1:21-1589(+)